MQKSPMYSSLLSPAGLPFPLCARLAFGSATCFPAPAPLGHTLSAAIFERLPRSGRSAASMAPLPLSSLTIISATPPAPISLGCDYFSTTPKWLGISGIAGSVGSVGPSKCRAIKIAPGFRSIGACQLLLGQVRKRRSRQSFHPPEKQPQLTILADGGSVERRPFRGEV